MKGLFTPATLLMDRLRYPVKFTIIFLIILIPIATLGYGLASNINEDIDFVKNERVGLNYIKAIRQPMEQIQQHRGMAAAFLNGSTEFRDRINQKQGTIDQKIAELKTVDERLGKQLGTGAEIANLTRQWADIKTDLTNLSAPQAIQLHSSLIAEMMRLIIKVADASQITLDPKLDTYYLGSALTTGLPNLIENMGQARAVGSGIAAKGAFTPQTRTKLAVLSSNINLYADGLNAGLQAAYTTNSALNNTLVNPTESNNKAVQDIQVLLKERLLNSDSITIGSDTVFNTTTSAIDSAYQLYDALAPKLDALFAKNIKSMQASMTVAIGTVVAVLFLIAYLFVGFYFSVHQSINKINEVATKLSNGDLTAQVALSAQDEMSQIADSFNKMASNFYQTIQQISNSAEQLGSSSEELSVIGVQNNQRVSAQKVQTEGVAAAMSEMTAAVQRVNESITNTTTSAENANRDTAEGREKVDSTIQAVQVLAEQIERGTSVIHQLEQDSKDISSVLDVIVGVAEQTNLLALNAAIEAARAGEHGRGFAVVADEVRTLAGRTQDSTKQISQVIEKLQTGSKKAVDVMKKSQQEAESVVSKATEAGTSLAAISSSVAQINKMSSHIASAAKEQSITTEQVNQSIVKIDEMTKETALSAQQTASASEELTQMTSELNAVVTRFTV